MPDMVKVHLWLLTVTLNNSKDTSSMKKFPIEIGSLHNKDLEKISAQIFQKKVTIYRMLHLVWPLLSRMCIIICCYNRASCAHGARRAHTLGPNGKNPPKTKLKHSWNYLREHSHMTSDGFWIFLTYLPTLIRCLMLYYISLFTKIRCSLTYLPKSLTSYVNAP